jgi:ubiquinone/menaquinone biosynthesis C-methylase UbiE
MRLDNILACKRANASNIPVCAPEDISERIQDSFRLLPTEPKKRKVLRAVAPLALRLLHRRNARLLTQPLSFPVSALCLEERFGDDASEAAFNRIAVGRQLRRVLVPGCYQGGDDVQRWLRRGVERVDGIDLNNLATRWAVIIPQLERHYRRTVRFQQAPLERLPLNDESFDVVATRAVLEHVQNLDAITSETARVLKPGGLAWHCFGPLYWCFGGDHCIDAYGSADGYNHLLLPESEYQARIRSQVFFDQQIDPNLPFWALRNQFSFAFAREYLAKFKEHFQIRHVVAKLSAPSLDFRQVWPDQWRQLREAGLAEEDLIIKGLSVVLEKT